MRRAVLLIGHGTVDALDDLAPFLANIRRGHAPPDELVREVRRRYEAIGGRSPLLAISRSLALKVEALLGAPVRVAMRLWHPYPREALADLVGAEPGPLGVAVVPLAQHSASVYAAAVREAASALPGVTVCAAANWGQAPTLIAAFADRVDRALGTLPADQRPSATVLFTAHSLPEAVIAAGDPYDAEVRAAAKLVARACKLIGRWAVCYQSQGIDARVRWLGPRLDEAVGEAKAHGASAVVVAPIGFLADHVEILYDLDIEAAKLASDLGVHLVRTESLNDSDELVRAVGEVARPLLEELG